MGTVVTSWTKHPRRNIKSDIATTSTISSAYERKESSLRYCHAGFEMHNGLRDDLQLAG